MSDLSIFFQNQYFIQIIGIIASSFIISGFGSKSDVKFKLLMVIGNIFFAAHFFMLGAFTAVGIDLINAARNAISIKFNKSKSLGFLFCALYLFIAFFTYETKIDIFPTLGAIIATLAIYNLSGKYLRYAMYLSSSLWLSYGIIINSWGTIITETFNILANTATIWRLLKEERK